METEPTSNQQIVVVGSGSAGLIAAISAQEQGAGVLILEKAPREARGGNGRFTGGSYRFFHSGTEEVLAFLDDLSDDERANMSAIEYSRSQFIDDLFRITENRADPEIASMVVDQSADLVRWLTKIGIKWEPNSGGSMKIGDLLYLGVPSRGRTVITAKGGGEGLIDQLFGIAERRGIRCLYETKATRLLLDDKGRVTGLEVKGREGFFRISCKAVILACGGFEASPEMRTKYLGPDWDEVRVRGTRYNTGDGLRMAQEVGAAIGGNLSGCHTSAVALEIPSFEGASGRYTRKAFPFGITVNIYGERFFDEGQDERANTYAVFGKAILMQPMGRAYQIFDADGSKFLFSNYQYSQPAIADSIKELGEMICLTTDRFVNTVREFNAAVQPGNFDPLKLDCKETKGLSIPKSNWAMPIKTPPFYAYTVVPGLAFTFGGIKIDPKTRALDTEGNPIPGLYAVGEITSEPFHVNYLGGAGLMAGAVTGRVAAISASTEVQGIP